MCLRKDQPVAVHFHGEVVPVVEGFPGSVHLVAVEFCRAIYLMIEESPEASHLVTVLLYLEHNHVVLCIREKAGAGTCFRGAYLGAS